MTFSAASVLVSTIRARREPSPIAAGTSTTSASPPLSLVSYDFGRISTMAGLALARYVATFAPPKYGTLATNPPSWGSTSIALEMRPTPRRAASRPATSRESELNAKRTRSGDSTVSSAARQSVAGSAMYSLNAASSLTSTRFAPCLPSAAAVSLPPGPSAIASTSPSSRAFVSSSSAVEAGRPSVCSA